MIPSRRTQPFRKGARAPGAALTAMMRGRSASGVNSADITRATQRLARAATKRKRPARPPRPPRPMR